MARGMPSRVPSDLAEVQRRIEQWRRVRSRRGVMPAALWSEAAAQATRHGLWRVARVLRVNYASLKAHVAASERGDAHSHGGRRVSFVELEGPGAGAWAGDSGAVVELSAADGAKLVIRGCHGEGVDVLALAQAFWTRRA